MDFDYQCKLPIANVEGVAVAGVPSIANREVIAL